MMRMVFFSIILFVISAGALKLILQQDTIAQFERTESDLKKEVSLLKSKLLSAENENKRLTIATNTNFKFPDNQLSKTQLQTPLPQPQKQLAQTSPQAEKIVAAELRSLNNHESLDESLARLSSHKNLSTHELKSKLDEEFSIAKNDLETAEVNQAVVHNVFSNNPDLSGIALTNAECKSNQCRLSIAIADASASNQLMQTLSKVFNGADARFSTAAILNSPDIKNNKITLYVMGIKNTN
ncbi:MAG: hypothetical protein V4660_08995 [Pseudomonadota bacterium]